MLGTVLEASKVTMKIHFLLSRGLSWGGDKANQQTITEGISHTKGPRIRTGTQHILKARVHRNKSPTESLK